MKPTFLILVALLLSANFAGACLCNGKQVECAPNCVQVCTSEGRQIQLCGKDAGKLLLSIGKDSPSWSQIQKAAQLFNHPEPEEVILRDQPDGSVTRVPVQLLRPFAGISISFREVAATDALYKLADVAGLKLEIAGQFAGSFSMVTHDAQLGDIMDAFCDAKDCVWSLRYSESGWILGVAGKSSVPRKDQQ